MHPFRHFRRVLFRHHTSHGLGTYPLPWPHLQKPVPTEPFWNKLAGWYLLNRVLQRGAGVNFNTTNFLEGVEDSIGSYIHMFKNRNTEVLQDIMYPKLYNNIHQSLSMLPSTSQILIDVESIRHVSLIGVNSMIGSADPDDAHTISFLGQTVVTSQKKLEGIVESQKDGFNFEHAKEIGKEATMTRMEFIMTVTFRTKEKYAVLDDKGTLIEGSNKIVNEYHMWKYGSVVDWDSDFPLEWRLYDINNYLHDTESTND